MGRGLGRKELLCYRAPFPPSLQALSVSHYLIRFYIVCPLQPHEAFLYNSRAAFLLYEWHSLQTHALRSVCESESCEYKLLDFLSVGEDAGKGRMAELISSSDPSLLPAIPLPERMGQIT